MRADFLNQRQRIGIFNLLTDRFSFRMQALAGVLQRALMKLMPFAPHDPERQKGRGNTAADYHQSADQCP